MDTNRAEDRWTCFSGKRRQNASAILQCCALGVTMSWNDGFPGARASRPHNDGFPGARASRPHQAWHSLSHLPHLDQTGTAPWLSFGLAAAVTADVVAACKAARKLSDHQRDSMRAGRPRSRGQSLPLWRGSRRSRAGRRRLMRRGGAESAPGNRYFFMNIDAQDKQDEGLLRGQLTPAMIRCGRPQFSKRDPPGSAGVPPAPSLAQPRPSPPLGSTGNGAMALLRPGRCGYCRRSGCLQSRAEAQRPPKGQHAGGTPALPGKAGPALPCGSFEEKRPIVDEDEPRMDTNEHEETGRQMDLLQRQAAPRCFCSFAMLCPWCDEVMG